MRARMSCIAAHRQIDIEAGRLAAWYNFDGMK